MKKYLSLILICGLLLCLSACNADQNIMPNSTAGNHTTQPQDDVTEPIPERDIEYPMLTGEGADYDKINSLIHQSVDNWIANELSEDVSFKLQHSVLRNDEKCVSVLFEGTVSAKDLAYPSKVVFPVTISKADSAVVNSFRYILANESFAAEFEEHLPSAFQAESYTQEQIDAIISYLNGTFEGHLQYLLTKADGAITENGLLVILEIPHAIGDYLKVEVPMEDDELEIIFLHQNDTISYNDSIFTLCEVSDNYELYYGDITSGYYFKIYNQNAELMDSGNYKSTTDISIVHGCIQLWYSVGMSNRMVKYYDVENGRISQLFNNPLAVCEELVVYTNIVNDSDCFVVQNIFDSNVYYQTFTMDPVPASVLGYEAEFIDNTHIQVSYMIENDEVYTTVIELG